MGMTVFDAYPVLLNSIEQFSTVQTGQVMLAGQSPFSRHCTLNWPSTMSSLAEVSFAPGWQEKKAYMYSLRPVDVEGKRWVVFCWGMGKALQAIAALQLGQSTMGEKRPSGWQVDSRLRLVLSGTVPSVAQVYSIISPTATGADNEALNEALVGTCMQWVISHSGQLMAACN